MNSAPKPNYKPEIIRKFKQLQIEFDDIPAAFEWNLPKMVDPSKIYLPREMGRYPFFFTANTNLVKLSRKGYYAMRKAKMLQAKNTPIAIINAETSYESNPLDFVYTSKDGWEIMAHQFYGFPDTLDGYVWSFLNTRISYVYERHKIFYLIYYINFPDIINYIIAKGYRKSKSGDLNVLVRDSIYRLMHTSYALNGSFFSKKNETYINSYSFSLITAVYEKGAIMMNGETAHGFAIAVDPIMISNFQNNHYLILINAYRSKIEHFHAQVMYDHIAYLSFIAFKAKTFTVASYHNYPFFFVRSYAKLCEFFGIKPLSHASRNLSPKKVMDQFAPYLDDLLKIGCLEKVMLDTTDKNNYSFVFVLSREFVGLSAGLFSKTEAYELLNSKPTTHVTKRFFAFTERAIKSPEIMLSLFPTKVFKNEEYSPEIIKEAETIISAENEFDLPF